MAQDNYLNLMAGSKLPDGSYSHLPVHGSGSASDMTISWDHTKFTTKASFRDALNKARDFINSRTDIAN